MRGRRGPGAARRPTGRTSRTRRPMPEVTTGDFTDRRLTTNGAGITIFYGDPDADIPQAAERRAARARSARPTATRASHDQHDPGRRPPPRCPGDDHHDRARGDDHDHRRPAARTTTTAAPVGRRCRRSSSSGASAPACVRSRSATPEADAAGGQPADDRAGARAPRPPRRRPRRCSSSATGPTPSSDAYPDGRCAGVELHYAVEPEPRDTAGAIRFAAARRRHRRALPRRQRRRAHRPRHRRRWSPPTTRAGAEGTIALHRVDDPSAFGVVPTERRRAGDRVHREAAAATRRPPT